MAQNIDPVKAEAGKKPNDSEKAAAPTSAPEGYVNRLTYEDLTGLAFYPADIEP